MMQKSITVWDLIKILLNLENQINIKYFTKSSLTVHLSKHFQQVAALQ